MLPKRLTDTDFTGFRWGDNDHVGYYHCGRIRAELDPAYASIGELRSWLEAAVRGEAEGLNNMLRWLEAPQRRPDFVAYRVILEASIVRGHDGALAYNDDNGWVPEDAGTGYSLDKARGLQMDLMPNKTRLEEVW